MAERTDSEDSEPVELPGAAGSSTEKGSTSPSPLWYERTIVVVGATAFGMILAGIGVFGLISASTESSIERDALETLAGLNDQLAQLQTDTQAVRTEIEAVHADTASTHESIAASEADTSLLEAALEETEDPIRELQSEAWELYVALQRVADLENSISDDLDAAVAAGSRREVGEMTSSVTSLESGQLADLDSAVAGLGEAVGKVQALLLVADTEFEVTEDLLQLNETQTTSPGPTTGDDGSAAEAPEGFTPYTDQDAGFSVAFPESWTAFPLTEQGLVEGEEALGADGQMVTENLRGYAIPFDGSLAMVDHRPGDPVETGRITYGAVIRYNWLAADPESAAEDARGIHDEQQDLQIDIEPFEMAAGDGIKMTFTLVWGTTTEHIIDYRIAGQSLDTWSIRFRTDRPDYYEDLTDSIARTFDLVTGQEGG